MERQGNYLHLTPEESDALGYISPVAVELVDVFVVQERLHAQEAELLARQSDNDFREHPKFAENVNEAMRLQKARRYLLELAELVGKEVTQELPTSDQNNN